MPNPNLYTEDYWKRFGRHVSIYGLITGGLAYLLKPKTEFGQRIKKTLEFQGLAAGAMGVGLELGSRQLAKEADATSICGLSEAALDECPFK